MQEHGKKSQAEEAREELRGVKRKDILMKQDIEVGFHEAGRRNVLGSVVCAAVAWPISARAHFSKMGFAESKKVAEEERKALFPLLQEFEHKLVHLAAEEIDSRWLERRGAASADFDVQLSRETVRRYTSILEDLLRRGLKVAKVHVDFDEDFLEQGKKLLCELEVVKARRIEVAAFGGGSGTVCPVVTAAMVAAKTLRLQKLQAQPLLRDLQLGAGSGNLRDQHTSRWLEDNFDPCFGFPPGVRLTASSIQKRLDGRVRYFWTKDCFQEKGIRDYFKGSDERSRGQLARALNYKNNYYI